MNLRVIFPRAFVVGEPQDGCHPLKSPVISEGVCCILNVLWSVWLVMFLVGELYVENMFNLSLDSIFMSIASISIIVLRIVYCIDLWTSSATPPNLLVAVFVNSL